MGTRAGFAMVLLAIAGSAGPVSAQVIKWQSQDSVAGGPRFEAYVGATVRFNASLDDYGLQGSYTFNPVNIDTLFGPDRDDNLLSFDLRQTRVKLGGTVRYEGWGPIETSSKSPLGDPSSAAAFGATR